MPNRHRQNDVVAYPFQASCRILIRTTKANDSDTPVVIAVSPPRPAGSKPLPRKGASPRLRQFIDHTTPRTDDDCRLVDGIRAKKSKESSGARFSVQPAVEPAFKIKSKIPPRKSTGSSSTLHDDNLEYSPSKMWNALVRTCGKSVVASITNILIHYIACRSRRHHPSVQSLQRQIHINIGLKSKSHVLYYPKRRVGGMFETSRQL